MKRAVCLRRGHGVQAAADLGGGELWCVGGAVRQDGVGGERHKNEAHTSTRMAARMAGLSLLLPHELMCVALVPFLPPHESTPAEGTQARSPGDGGAAAGPYLST